MTVEDQGGQSNASQGEAKKNEKQGESSLVSLPILSTPMKVILKMSLSPLTSLNLSGFWIQVPLSMLLVTLENLKHITSILLIVNKPCILRMELLNQ